MTDLTIALLSFPVLLTLIFLRMPIGLAMTLCGMGGMVIIHGTLTPLLAQLKSLTYSTFSTYSLTIIPLFLLMGNFAAAGGLSAALFRLAAALVGHRRGGLATAAITASAGFGAICGSSIATAAAMGKIALPELKKQQVPAGFATATLAAGGTLGVLIPPSLVLIVYAILTEQNIEKLFAAALIPGLIAVIGYVLAIRWSTRHRETDISTLEPASASERRAALAAVWPVLAIFVLSIGGIVTGLFSPTQGAAVGAGATGLLTWARGQLTRTALVTAIHDTATTTAMVFFILYGAGLFNSFLALSQLPQAVAEWIANAQIQPFVLLILILLLYLLLGCIMESLSMILLTVPIFYPILLGLDFGLTETEFSLWFGILVLIVVEVGLITPPIGLNLFVISGLSPDTPVNQTYRAILPFIAADVARVAILVAFPVLALWLV